LGSATGPETKPQLLMQFIADVSQLI
jgi:hypothetical protein